MGQQRRGQSTQANFMCPAHNQIVLSMTVNWKRKAPAMTPEIQRRVQRLCVRTNAAIKAERQMPSIISGVQWATQRSVKLIRWIRSLLWINMPLPQMHASLRQLYAEL